MEKDWHAPLSVAKGEVVTLIGANGSGKTTIIKSISGLLPLVGGGSGTRASPLVRFLPTIV